MWDLPRALQLIPPQQPLLRSWPHVSLGYSASWIPYPNPRPCLCFLFPEWLAAAAVHLVLFLPPPAEATMMWNFSPSAFNSTFLSSPPTPPPPFFFPCKLVENNFVLISNRWWQDIYLVRELLVTWWPHAIIRASLNWKHKTALSADSAHTAAMKLYECLRSLSWVMRIR